MEYNHRHRNNMLSEQAILAEQLTSNSETMPLGFIISDDGRTLLAVTERDDGVLEFMSVPMTLQQSNIITALPLKQNEGNPIFQLTLEGMSADGAGHGAAIFSQGYQALSADDGGAESNYATGKEIQLDYPGTVLFTPGGTGTSCLETKSFEIFEAPAPMPPPVTTTVIKRSPGRPRKDGSTPPSHINNLKCKICGKGFNRLMLLRRHVEQHAEEKPHRCPKCPASFNVPTNFTLHMATHNIGEPKCPECGRKFARMASLKSHMLMHEKEENLFCTECEDAFTTKAQLDAHLKLHNEKWTTEDVRKCKLCNKQFTQPALYRLHIREHYRLQTKLVKQTKKGVKQKTIYKCKICLKSFQKPSQLVRHIRVHTGEKPFQCTICSRAFTQKGSLQIHMWKHNGYRPHNCSLCSAKFSQKGNLNAHVLRVHNLPDGKPYYKCTQCPCTFKKLGSLNGHMKKMHSDPIKKAQSCDSSTEDMQATVDTVMSQLAMLESSVKNPADSTANNPTNKDILQQALKNSGLPSKDKESAAGQVQKKGEAHTTMVTLLDSSIDSATRKYVTIKQRTIGNIRWYTCSYCYKEFKKPSDLIRHLRIHTQEKPFKCSYCSRSFAVKSTMIAHERTHTGVKKYMCRNCNKMFACQSSLTLHMKVHAGVKPFVCNICDKSFAANTLLKVHMKYHAKGKTKPSREAEVLAPSIVLEEPLIITDAGNKISIAQVPSKHQQVYNSNDVARPHKCWVCPAAFRKISHLKQHFRRHTGEKPYKCQKCNRRFTSNSVLKSHLRTHEGSRPYDCPICTAKFSTQSSMKRHLATHSNKRPFMCPYCHKTFKTSVNCRKHMKIHKQEIAQQQLHQQSQQQQPNEATGKPGINVLPENIILADHVEVTFQPQMAPDFTQAFSDQFHTIPVEKDKALSAENNTIETIVNQTLPAVEPLNLGPSQTLHADETGTITLPNYSGDQTLTPESIREIEETLNQQLFNIGMNLGLGGNLTRQISETTPNSLEPQDQQPILNIIYGNTKNIDTPAGNSAINTGIFSPQFDAFDMSQITLQADNEMDIGITPANSTSMASILPKSAQEEQHLVSVTTTSSMPEDSQSKQTRHLMVVSSMQTCPELSRPVQACPKYPKVIAKADTTDGSDAQSPEEATKDDVKPPSLLLPEKPPPVLSYQCKICDKYFQKRTQLRTHRKIHALGTAEKPVNDQLSNGTESDNLLQCHMCSKSGFTAAALKDHLKTHIGGKEFQCTECPLKFCTNGGLSRHVKSHVNKVQWKCPTCNLSFQNKILLAIHEEFHENSNQLNKVEPDSSQKDPLTIDGNYMTNSEIRLGGGSKVSEKFLVDAVAQKETGIKKEKKVYTNKCKYCPKTFRKPSDLVRHIRTHTGERPYQCEYCNKCFAVKCTLDCHMKVHTGKKTFSCHVCNSLFTTKGSLKVHMRLHTGSKPFKCNSCDLRFRTSGHRKVHLLTHMREHRDPFKNKPKHRKVAAIAEVAAELEKNVENEVNAEASMSQGAEYSNIDSITIDANTLTDAITPHITFNADGTILNNNAMLSINESNQLVANLHFLLANGLVTIQTDDALLQHLPEAEDNDEIMESESLRERTESLINESNQQAVFYETERAGNGGTESHGTLELDRCIEMRSPDEIVSLSDTEERGSKLTVDKTQFRRECDICGKGFLKPCQVERHKRIHTGEKPYKCNLCSKSFTQKNTLKVHQKHHTGDRPHPCPHCNLSFTQKGNLKTHLKRVHQLDTLDVKKIRRGQHVLSAKFTQDNLEEAKIISLGDISFANIP